MPVQRSKQEYVIVTSVRWIHALSMHAQVSCEKYTHSSIISTGLKILFCNPINQESVLTDHVAFDSCMLVSQKRKYYIHERIFFPGLIFMLAPGCGESSCSRTAGGLTENEQKMLCFCCNTGLGVNPSLI